MVNTKFSRTWKSSKLPRKQRKYLKNAPLHIRRKFVKSHLSKDLMKKYSTRSIQLKKGDKVKILRGQFSGKTGKVKKINLKLSKIYIEGVESFKKDGNKSFYPIHASNLLILELMTEDKKRFKTLNVKVVKSGGKNHG